MHDHSLGGPVDIGEQPDANHSGPCNDGVYGCSRCRNAANDGKGTTSECDWCHVTSLTRVVRMHDEPVSYALCEACRDRYRDAVAREHEDELLRSRAG